MLPKSNRKRTYKTVDSRAKFQEKKIKLGKKNFRMHEFDPKKHYSSEDRNREGGMLKEVETYIHNRLQLQKIISQVQFLKVT